LRGPQQDALRTYVKVADKRDIAFELPTGSGKTMIGLLIAEWQRRRNGSRIAFLTLTNQLAAQVIEEAKRLNLPVADLRGNRDRRSTAEEGRFLDGTAIAVSTYSNLFNVKPVINQCDTIVLDDAHGGGEYAASMWTVRVKQAEFGAIFQQLLDTLTPLMTEAQNAEVFDLGAWSRIAIVDLGILPAAKEHIVQILDRLPEDTNPRFAWFLTRPHLHACHIFVSKDAIAIRPYISPTYDHDPFCSVKHRIYLSASLGDVEDLRRTYAIEQIEAIRAAQEQDGRRYVFAPGLALGEEEILEALRIIWVQLRPQRVVAIAPSFSALAKLQAELESAMGSRLNVLGARDIEESLSPFTDAKTALLALANRYDGLDLPDDDCRMLVLGESPRATNELETNLSNVWKLGPALRWREATRLVQGMGRCTRSATDFSIIILLGESLVNAATNASLLRLLPISLQKEIEWGRVQVKELGNEPETFANMVISLIDDVSYRTEADELIAEQKEARGRATSPNLAVAAKEVAHSRAFWAGDYSRAQELASEIVDLLSGEEWAGYRAWWLYSVSLAARYVDNLGAELDALRRAKGTGINAGWLDNLLRVRGRTKELPKHGADDLAGIVAERVWNTLEELGWSGKRFGTYCDTMLQQLASTEHKAFHQGLEALGRLLGAQASRPDGQGDPDVIWKLTDQVWISFEAKTEKLKDGAGISKKDVLEARGHVDWVRFFKTQGKPGVDILAVIVAPSSKVHSAAEPFKGSLYFIALGDALEWANRNRSSLTQLRTKYAGQDFAAAREAFAHDLKRLRLDAAATLATIKETQL